MFNAFYKTFMVSTARAKRPLLRCSFVCFVSSFRQKRLLLFFLVSSRKLVFVAWFPFFFHLCKPFVKRLKSSLLTFIILLCLLFIITQQSNTSVYVGVIIAGALVGEKMVNKGFDSMWESRNKGKLFKDLKLPDAEE